MVSQVRCSCTGKMGCAGQRFCNEDSLGNANIVSVGPFGDVTDVDACSDGNTSFNDTKSAMDVVTWKVGDDAEYLSSTFDKWIPCKILEVESTASVQAQGGKHETSQQKAQTPLIGQLIEHVFAANTASLCLFVCSIVSWSLHVLEL